ncbi:collagen, type I, alpha 1a-like [Phalacrocorax carbo]|uniref:collagen, type I, alpha 1a-like n=1 Tax=Phalacrocorax carbo TaxID=9209 RepID=UPI0031196058
MRRETSHEETAFVTGSSSSFRRARRCHGKAAPAADRASSHPFLPQGGKGQRGRAGAEHRAGLRLRPTGTPGPLRAAPPPARLRCFPASPVTPQARGRPGPAPTPTATYLLGAGGRRGAPPSPTSRAISPHRPALPNQNPPRRPGGGVVRLCQSPRLEGRDLSPWQREPGLLECRGAVAPYRAVRTVPSRPVSCRPVVPSPADPHQDTGGTPPSAPARRRHLALKKQRFLTRRRGTAR